MDDRSLVKALKALGHPMRFQMVQEIAKAGELSCGQIQERFPVAQPTISHHLKILTDAGILVQRRQGQHCFTSVNQEAVDTVLGSLPERLTSRPPRRAAPKGGGTSARRT